MSNADNPPTQLSKPDAVYFDVDGTLLYTRNTYAAIQEYVKEKGSELPADVDRTITERSKLLRDKAGMHNDDDILEGAYFVDPDDPEEKISLSRKLADLLSAKHPDITGAQVDSDLRARRMGITNYSAYEGAVENIQTLRDAGIKVGFITTTPENVIKEQLIKNRLMHKGDALFTRENGVSNKDTAASEAVGSANKHPFIKQAAEQDGITIGNNVWYVGDRPEDAADAVRAGATAIHFGAIGAGDTLARTVENYLPAIAQKYGTTPVIYARALDHSALHDLLIMHMHPATMHPGPKSEKAAETKNTGGWSQNI